MKTVFFKGMEIKAIETVYEPSDDSFLLAKNVKITRDSTVLDIGTGTGIQAINAAMQGAKKVVCTDINEKALENAKKNAGSLGLLEKLEFRKGNLFGCLKSKEKFDVMIFNPPYVPTEEKKFSDLDGGKKGRDVIDKFLEDFPAHLKQDGECFFLQTSLNGEKETRNKLGKKGFEAKKIAEKRIFFETLIVFKAKRKLKKKVY